MAGAEHAQHQQHVQPVVVLHQRGHHAHAHTDDGAEVGHETDQAGDHAYQRPHVDADQAQADRVQQPQHQHHAELPAQEMPQHLVGIARQARDGGSILRGSSSCTRATSTSQSRSR